VKSFTISSNDAGQRLDRFLEKAAPLLPSGLAQKYLRLKRCKINGKAAQRDYRLQSGDLLELYINDEFFERPNEDNAYLAISVPKVDVLYEDENILLALKPFGQLSHPDGSEFINTLITHIQAYLLAHGEWNPNDSATFRPALCNRIDRNTGGIVLAAKTASALRILTEKVRSREIDKLYLAAVSGVLRPSSGQIEGFIFKDSKLNRVYASDRSSKGSKSAVTEYRTIAAANGNSLLECRLITGRTHQIRAQLAAAGHPLIGDGKYGKASAEEKYQALYSYKLRFSFSSDAAELNYLSGKTFTAPLNRIPFIEKFFPKIRI